MSCFNWKINYSSVSQKLNLRRKQRPSWIYFTSFPRNMSLHRLRAVSLFLQITPGECTRASSGKAVRETLETRAAAGEEEKRDCPQSQSKWNMRKRKIRLADGWCVDKKLSAFETNWQVDDSWSTADSLSPFLKIEKLDKEQREAMLNALVPKLQSCLRTYNRKFHRLEDSISKS